MILRTKKTEQQTIIYEYKERKQAAKDVNALKTIHSFKVVDFELAAEDKKGFYILEKVSKQVLELEKITTSV